MKDTKQRNQNERKSNADQLLHYLCTTNPHGSIEEIYESWILQATEIPPVGELPVLFKMISCYQSIKIPYQQIQSCYQQVMQRGDM